MRLRFCTYNARHCLGLDGNVSLVAVAGAVSGNDIIGLQEMDRYNPRSGFTDQPRQLGALLDMHYVYGANINILGITGFGNAVLSRFPILNRHNYQLPRTGQKRGLLRTVIVAGGRQLAFYCTHLGLDKSERRRQVKEILNIIAGERLPMVLAGDFNATPEAQEILDLKKTLFACDPGELVPTFPAEKPRYKIDYIFYSGHWLLVEKKVIVSTASDHLPLSAELQLA